MAEWCLLSAIMEDGADFTEALGKASQVQFELRDPKNGQLLLEFPLNRI